MIRNALKATRTALDVPACIGWLILLIGVSLLVYRDTWLSMLDIWLRMDTFSHGLLVIPISIYLVWRQRAEVMSVGKRPSGLGVLLLFFLSIAWWLSMALGLQVGMHAAVVAMLPVLVLALCGMDVARTLCFPLTFLIFAVPFGEFVIPTLVDATASLTVNSVRALGVPVIRDGQYFFVSSGSYSIAKACAGLNYTIAAFAFASIAARAYFKSLAKGTLFIGFAVLMSIVANGIRATAIVLIMHYSDFDIRAAKDHEFVGWIVYGLLIAVLLGVAAWLGDAHQSSAASTIIRTTTEPADSDISSHRSTWAVTLACAVMVASGALLSTISASASDSMASYRELPQMPGWNFRSSVEERVFPSYKGFTSSLAGTYTRYRFTVYVSLLSYEEASQGTEMINAANFVLPEQEWKLDFPSTVELNEEALPTVLETIGRSRLGAGSVVVWYWYEVNSRQTTSTFEAKLMEAKNFLTFQPSDSTVIIVTSPMLGSRDESRELMREFVGDFYPMLRECISDGHAAGCGEIETIRGH